MLGSPGTSLCARRAECGRAPLRYLAAYFAGCGNQGMALLAQTRALPAFTPKQEQPISATAPCFRGLLRPPAEPRSGHQRKRRSRVWHEH